MIGVSIAFFVDSWKEDRKAKRDEISLLQALKNDITTDSLTLVKNMEVLDRFIATYNRVLKDGFSKDSAVYEIDRIITYIPYCPVDLSYREMQQTGTSAIITNKALLYKIITLNEKLMGIINEDISIDRNFILERMIPFLEMHANYPYEKKRTIPC